jgi:subtilisin family serine protease
VVDDERALTGAGVQCYVLDSGVNFAHAEFRDSPWVEDSIEFDAIRLMRGQQQDETGHGTHVAGIIGGEAETQQDNSSVMSADSFRYLL